jgi:hypothetical protein
MSNRLNNNVTNGSQQHPVVLSDTDTDEGVVDLTDSQEAVYSRNTPVPSLDLVFLPVPVVHDCALSTEPLLSHVSHVPVPHIGFGVAPSIREFNRCRRMLLLPPGRPVTNLKIRKQRVVMNFKLKIVYTMTEYFA